MRLERIAIQNYKSLRNVEFTPGDISVIVGANASGKSNLVDCLDFVSEVYRLGLEDAVKRKGGFENIVLRAEHSTKEVISITVEISLGQRESAELIRPPAAHRNSRPEITLRHIFAIEAAGSGVTAEYCVVNEHLTASLIAPGLAVGHAARILDITRGGGQIGLEGPDDLDEAGEWLSGQHGSIELNVDARQLRIMLGAGGDGHDVVGKRSSPPDSALLVDLIDRYTSPLLQRFKVSLSGLRAFQIAPNRARESGVATPQPDYDRFGGNLPVTVEKMKKNPESWAAVLDAMQVILPELEDITVGVTHDRRLSLSFHERGVGQSWNAEEISDGTLHALSLFIRLFDPRINVLVIDEPENSAHPWLIRYLMEHLRDASSARQVILTTHSPVVIDSVTPEDIWVMWRAEGESNMRRLDVLDNDIVELWKQGKVSTFDYLDSGLLREPVPPAPSVREPA